MPVYKQASLHPKYRSKIEYIYDEYKNDMLYTALGIVRDFNQAEDIVQLAFIRIMKHIEKINGLSGNEVKGYIIYIVKNLSIDYIRKQKHDKTIPYDSIDYSINDGDSLEITAMQNLKLGMVKKKLKEMDDIYALPLILKYTLGFSYSEIADLLDISIENVKVRCHRGRRKLVEAIGKEAMYEETV